MSDKKLVIKEIVEKKQGAPLVVPNEVLLLLLDKPNLLSLLLGLSFLSQLNVPVFVTQPQLSKLLGLSYLTFLKRRKKLEELGLLTTDVVSGNFTKIELKTDLTFGLINFIRGHKDFIRPKNFSELVKYIDKSRKYIVEGLAKKGQMALTDAIYNIKSSSPPSSNTTPIKRYPRVNYTRVIEAYNKYKGISLKGPEVAQGMRAIKTMFKADRTPEQIIGLMKWFSDHEDDEDKSWIRSWTIWTVQKKLPEFVAGKLKERKVGDELEDIRTT